MGVLRDSRAGGVPDDRRRARAGREPLRAAGGERPATGSRSGSYRPDQELVIDPGVQYATFLGGASHELATGIAVDAAGNAYVVGTTQSPDFPTTAGLVQANGRDRATSRMSSSAS